MRPRAVRSRRPSAARRVWVVVATALFAAVAGGTAAAPAPAAGPPACGSSTSAPYSMALRALTGPARTDVAISFTAAEGCGAVETVKHVQLKSFTAAGALDDVVTVDGVAVESGTAVVALRRVEPGRDIDLQVLVQTGTPPRTYVLRGTTTSRLRPDLAVTVVRAPEQTLTTEPVVVSADVEELDGDTDAEADVTLSSTIGPLAGPIHVTVPAGKAVSLAFPEVTLTEALATELKVTVADTDPAEANLANNQKRAVVEVTKNELASSRVLVQKLGGYGFQFNNHLYAAITSPPPETLPDLESKVKALQPQLVRIFFNENWELNADPRNNPHPEWKDNLESFRRVVRLANDSGATIAIAYQGVATAKTNPTLWMTKFADELRELVVARGLTGVAWATIGNEPNSTALTLQQYEALYRALDTQLEAKGIRDRIRLIGGDLVQNNEGTPGGHRAWFDYMVAHMNDVIDAWSEHIYWRYDQPWRMEERLKDVAHLVHEELPEAARKPTLLMEFGVRGFDTCGTNPLVKFAYYPNQDGSCTDLRRMPLAGFHKLWFDINAAQLGFDGTSDWDLYWSIYDRTNPPNQSFWAIGPPSEGWALYPSYHALRMLLQTTRRGWQVLAVDPWTADDAAARFDSIVRDRPEQELAAFAGDDGTMTILGLDTNGGGLTAPSGESSSYSIGNLPRSKTFRLAVWNANGDGLTTDGGTVTTNAAGVARFDVPLQAAFALTTLPVG